MKNARPFPEGSGGGRSPGRRKTGADGGDRTRIPEFRGQILSLLCIPVPPRPLEVPQPSADCGCRGSITRFQGRTICRRNAGGPARKRPGPRGAGCRPAAGRRPHERLRNTLAGNMEGVIIKTVQVNSIRAPLRKREEDMAERKSAFRRVPERPELDRLLEQAKTVHLTDADLDEQRASFVYGNAPGNSRITKESVQRAAGRIRFNTA